VSKEGELRLAVGLLAGAVIVYEIALTRLFSFLLHYHYTFLVVSGAVCGLGLGAALAFFMRPPEPLLRRWLAGAALICALGMGATAHVLSTQPNLPPLALALVAGLPIALAGLFLTWVFSLRRSQSASFYFFDLVGAALGTLAAIPALQYLGGPGTLLLASALVLSASAAALGQRALFWATALPFVALFLQVGIPRVDLSALAADKPMFRALQAREPGKAVASRWSAYARTDIVDRSGDSGLNFYVDGAAGSYMFRFNGDFRRLFFLRREAAFFPYYFGPRDQALIIGPGGGQDVLYALMTGWKAIEGVEVNPEIVALMGEYGHYNGQLFAREGVQIHIGDGRHFLENSTRRYNLIALPLVYAEAADLVGYALLENYLFTREAFAAYFEHLAPGGRLALVVHNHALMLRTVSTLAALWQQRGLDPSTLLDHLLVVNGTRADPRAEQAQRPLILVQKEAYTKTQLKSMRAVLAPLRRTGLAAFVASVPQDISPVTDQRPFFYDVEKGLEHKLQNVLWGAALACVLVLLIPLVHADARRRAGMHVPALLLAVYASGLGAGFMMIEMYLLQRIGLFLGYPTLSLAATLFGILLAAGAGSLLGAQVRLLRAASGLGLATVGIGLFCALYSWPLDKLLDYGHAWPVGARAALILVLAGVPGFLLGALFPAAMSLARGPITVPWMWAANGFASVLGSVLAVALSMEWGATDALRAGGGLYIVAGLVLFFGGRGLAKTEANADFLPWRRLVLFLSVVAVLWYSAFSFVADHYGRAASGPTQPRPPVVPQVWPQALLKGR
jgi:hypothetical protein